MRIKIDDTEIVGEYLLAAVCNGSTYGGGYNAAPCADLTDGLLDVILVKKISRLRIAKVLAIYKKGEHILNGKIIPELQDIMLYKRAKAIQITPLDGEDIIINIDGECEPASSANLSVMPLSAKFVLPKCVYQRYVNKMAIV